MRVDEAGDDDVAGDVDHLGVDVAQVGADGGDAAVLDEDVADQVAQVRVHGEHVPAPQEQPVGHGRHLATLVRLRCANSPTAQRQPFVQTYSTEGG